MDYDNYYKKKKVKDQSLVIYVINAEMEAKKYIDEKKDGEKLGDERLIALGFK
jgi:hypothetical protein